MRRAVAGLAVRPGYVLSDGFRVPGLPMPSLPVIGGDAAAACIAAASVLAKVSRDRVMVALDADHPGYGFAEHKGYSTPAHSRALARLGPCPQHRYSFINVRRVASGSNTAEVADGQPDPRDGTAQTGEGRWSKSSHPATMRATGRAQGT
ncbi:ribonuclease HII [Mycobacterium tuberculosis]|nr:ribonuclease HII [Mycobacterium tuberculosis]